MRLFTLSFFNALFFNCFMRSLKLDEIELLAQRLYKCGLLRRVKMATISDEY